MATHLLAVLRLPNSTVMANNLRRLRVNTEHTVNHHPLRKDTTGHHHSLRVITARRHHNPLQANIPGTAKLLRRMAAHIPPRAGIIPHQTNPTVVTLHSRHINRATARFLLVLQVLLPLSKATALLRQLGAVLPPRQVWATAPRRSFSGMPTPTHRLFEVR